MPQEVILYSLRIRFLLLFIFISSFCFGQSKFTAGTKVDDVFYDSLPLANEEFRGSIPSDYSIKKFAAKAGNQLSYKHSTAWSIAGAATILESIGYGRINRAETTKNLKSPYFVNMLFADSVKVCEEEISLGTALHLVSVYGLPSLLQYINICPTSVSEKAMKYASRARYYTYYKTFERTDEEEAKLKRLKTKLVMDKPVIIAMHTPYSFQNAKESWQPTEVFNEELPLQCMIVVGYDDKKNGGSFQVLNSWGSDWGDDGYTWIPYKEFQFVRYGYSLETKYSGDEPLSYTGNFILELSDSTQITLEAGKQKGTFYPLVMHDNFGFRIKGKSNKPIYIKCYYKSLNGEVAQVYPTSSWRSALLEHTFRDFSLPDEKNFYTISNESYFKIFVFLSPGDITNTDFTELVAGANTSLDIIRSDQYNFGKNVTWSAEEVQYFARLQESHIIPVVFEFDINRSINQEPK